MQPAMTWLATRAAQISCKAGGNDGSFGETQRVRGPGLGAFAAPTYIHNRETLPADQALPPGLEEASLTSPAAETVSYQDKVRTCTTVGKMHSGRLRSRGAKRVSVGKERQCSIPEVVGKQENVARAPGASFQPQQPSRTQ